MTDVCYIQPQTPALSRYQNPDLISNLLYNARTVAVVGLSPNVLRPSNFVGFYLQRHGYRIVPVNPREKEILGETSYPSLKTIPFPVDIVDVFRASDAVPDIAREAVAIGAGALWLQFGVISMDGADIAEKGGVKVVIDRCMKVELRPAYGTDALWLGFNTGNITTQTPIRPLN